ncbi:MAG: hypothetical protein PVSMB5_12040 [Ktedonobacteraceae bacterium]
MSTSNQPSREHPSTYFVQNRQNKDEMTRLMIQDRMMTAGMGGVLSEQSNTASFQRILDVGCGTGNWLLEVASLYPDASELIGVDVSKAMLTYARAQAEAQGVGDRVTFRVMDALRMLEFPANTFDLVNQRFGNSYLRTWDWPRLLQEYQRVCKPGGMIRITEAQFAVESNSSALTHLFKLGHDAFYLGGHFFRQSNDGLTAELPRLLHQYGVQDVQSLPHALVFRSGTEEGENFYEDMAHLFHTIIPFLRKWTRVPDDYEQFYQQALREMRQPDFTATWHLLTAWGNAPLNKAPNMPSIEHR